MNRNDLLDQHDGNGEQQRESDISKSVDHIELLCQDQVRESISSFFLNNFLDMNRFWIYLWTYERLNISCGKEVAISFCAFVQNLNPLSIFVFRLYHTFNIHFFFILYILSSCREFFLAVLN